MVLSNLGFANDSTKARKLVYCGLVLEANPSPAECLTWKKAHKLGIGRCQLSQFGLSDKIQGLQKYRVSRHVRLSSVSHSRDDDFCVIASQRANGRVS